MMMVTRVRTLVAAAVVAVFAAACGDTPAASPSPSEIGTTPAASPTPTETQTPTPTLEPSPTPTTPEFEVDLVVAGDALTTIGPDGAPSTLLDTGAVDYAVSDGAGGFAFQHVGD